jgi:hypothetical protein
MIIKRENAVKGFFFFFSSVRRYSRLLLRLGAGSVCGQRCVPVLLYTAVAVAAAADELADVEKR